MKLVVNLSGDIDEDTARLIQYNVSRALDIAFAGGMISTFDRNTNMRITPFNYNYPDIIEDDE